MNKDKQMILAIRADGSPLKEMPTGFHAMPADKIMETLESAGLWIGPRGWLETDETYRQIIPYIVLKVGERYVRYLRSPAGGEDRLHGMISIGIGGHVDLEDVLTFSSPQNPIALAETIQEAARREIEEELGWIESEAPQWFGLLVDNSDPVGRVHIGVVGMWELADAPEYAEDAIDEIGLMTLGELQAVSDRLEGWSRILVDALAGVNHE